MKRNKSHSNIIPLRGAQAQGLRVVPAHVNQNTVSALTHLLAEARLGRVIGLAYVALIAGDEYQGDVTGAAESHPTYTRGLLLRLDDILKEKCR